MALTYPNINSQISPGFQIRRNFSDLLNGITDGSEAAAGQVGEFTSANPGGAVTPAASGSFITIVSLSLTAGKWEIYGCGSFTPGTLVTLTRTQIALSLTTNALDSSVSGNTNVSSSTGTTFTTYQPIARRINSSSSFTIYLVGEINYAVLGTATFNTDSFIRATRTA